MEVIAIANHKGGVGKTTTAINLAASLALRGKNALLIDVDPQANASVSVNAPTSPLTKTIYPALISYGSSADPISHALHSVSENFDFIASCPMLTEAEQLLTRKARRHERLTMAIKETILQDRDYDYILIDCPPGIGVLTENAIFAADRLILTIQTSFLALQGIASIIDFSRKVTDKRDKPLITRALATMFDQRKKIAKEVLSDIKTHFEHRLYNTVIRVNVKLEEAASFGVPITEYQKRSQGYKDYMSLAKEVIAGK